MLAFFYSEWLLFLALPVVLSLNLVLTLMRNNADQDTDPFLLKKKHFFLVLRVAKLVLIVCMFKDLEQLLLPNIDTLIFYNGTTCLRYDLISYAFNLLLTFLTLYFLSIIRVVFARTTENIKYINEIPFLILCAVLSLRIFIAATDFFLIIITLEIASFCTIIFLGLQSVSPTRYQLSLEATIKYFIINAIAIALIIFSILGYFYMTSSTNLLEISAFFTKFPFLTVFFAENLILIQGLFFFSYFVKLGVAPMYHWVPDVYEGAELIVTIFLVLVIGPALLLKGLIFIKALTFNKLLSSSLNIIMLYGGILSVILGTINAFYQTRIKRFIAYSSITHLGFLFLGLSANTFVGYFSFICYLIIYIVTNVVFFTLLILCQYVIVAKKTRAIIFINQLKTTLQSSLFVFVGFLVACCSFAGIPPFAGFFAKFFVLCSLLNANHWLILGILVIFILIGTFLYIRFIKIVFFETIRLSTIYIAIKALSSTTFYQLILKSRVPDEPKIQTKAATVLYLVTTWLIYFLTSFLFFFSAYCLFAFDIILNLLTLY